MTRSVFVDWFPKMKEEKPINCMSEMIYSKKTYKMLKIQKRYTHQSKLTCFRRFGDLNP